MNAVGVWRLAEKGLPNRVYRGAYQSVDSAGSVLQQWLRISVQPQVDACQNLVVPGASGERTLNDERQRKD